ncbi:MAG: DegT/DnrJ/EryC1/StrS family aminotransferase [Nitrospiraceae bacterium]|nr:DegT/DnrJ/EryC1/StrS family aminotransferase [Nitrospiraceae bacterium]
MLVRIRPFLDVGKISRALERATELDDRPIKEFETAFARRLGAPGAAAVDRGRSALLLALKTLGIKGGDEVIVQSYIFHVVVDAILELGARPVLADSRLDDFNVDPRAIERGITPRTRAIIVTHLGVPCDMGEISAIARKHDCYLIENCAHTLDAQCDGKKAGGFGDVSFYSFDIDKPISTGDGGMLLINNVDLLEKARGILDGYGRVPFEKEKQTVYGLLLQHFVTGDGVYPEDGFLPVDFGKKAVKKDRRLLSLVEKAACQGGTDGFRERILPYLQRNRLLCEKKSRTGDIISRAASRAGVALGRMNIPKIDSPLLLMNSLRSAVGIECLKDFDNCKALRDQNTQYYIDHLDTAAFGHPRIDKGKKTAFIRYAVLNNTGCENSRITAAARKRGFEIGIFNWSAPVHLCYPYNRLLDFERSKLHNSEHLGRRLLSLPVHPYVGEEALERICRFLNGFTS